MRGFAARGGVSDTRRLKGHLCPRGMHIVRGSPAVLRIESALNITRLACKGPSASQGRRDNQAAQVTWALDLKCLPSHHQQQKAGFEFRGMLDDDQTASTSPRSPFWPRCGWSTFLSRAFGADLGSVADSGRSSYHSWHCWNARKGGHLRRCLCLRKLRGDRYSRQWRHIVQTREPSSNRRALIASRVNSISSVLFTRGRSVTHRNLGALAESWLETERLSIILLWNALR